MWDRDLDRVVFVLTICVCSIYFGSFFWKFSPILVCFFGGLCCGLISRLWSGGSKKAIGIAPRNPPAVYSH